MQCPVQHPDNMGVLLDYCAQALSKPAVAEFETHLFGCSECRQFIAEQQEMWTALDEWEASPISEDFDKKLYNRIGELERQTFLQKLRLSAFSWKPALSIAAACAIVTLGFVLQLPPTYKSPAVPDGVQETSKMEAVEPEQIERALEDIEMLKQLSASAGQNL